MGYRIMRDTLGEVRVPEGAYYGPQTQRAKENFPISGLRLPRVFIRAQGIIKAAAAYANQRVGMLDEKRAAAIIQAAEEVIEGRWDDHFVVDVYQAGAGTSQNMNANEVIANRAAELLGGKVGDTQLVHPNDHVNMAQSTNDTIHVAINVAAAEQMVGRLLPALKRLYDALAQKAEAFQPIVKSGRTHLQDAVPIRLGQEFSGYAVTLKRNIAQLEQILRELYPIGLGGNAVGTGVNAHPDYPKLAVQQVAERTGLPFCLPENRFYFMQNTHGAIRVSGALKHLAVDLIKISSDLRLLSSGPRTGLAEIRLPAVQPGSSIMPGKVNPVMAEMMYMVCSQVIGGDAVIAAAGMGSQLEINVMMPVIAFNLLHSLEILANSMDAFTERCIKGIEVNEAQCRYWLERSAAIATVLNPVIGYERAASLAKRALEENRTVRQLVLESGILPPDEAEKLFQYERMT